MRLKTQTPVPCSTETMERVRQRLERWRRTRKHLSPIPAALWSAAVELAGELGLTPTARALGLDYNSLKKRLEASVGRESTALVSGPRFIELVPPPARSTGECTVEMEHPCGSKRRIHFTGGAMPDLDTLSRAFLSSGT